MSKPWMKFYPADWRSDPALRMCPLAARGLWMEMLAIMHEAEPYGHLVVKGRPVDALALAKLVGIGLKECRNLLATLRQVGVFSETETGIIFSRRMTRDHAKALKDKENGYKGGNPELLRGVNPQDKAQKPEARDQIPDGSGRTVEPPPEKPETDNRSAAAPTARPRGPYAFEAGIIRLNQRDYERWAKAWPALNLDGELCGLAGVAQKEHDAGGSWFHFVAGVLAKRDRERSLTIEDMRVKAAALAAAPVKPKIAYLGP